MKYLVLVFLLNSCSSTPAWRVLRCPSYETECTLGNLKFKTLSSCDYFVDKAKISQGDVVRMCIFIDGGE